MMDDDTPPDDAGTPLPSAFDKEAARRRYRATMRSPLMRAMYILLALVLLASWGLGVVAAIARDVERLPGHDFRVPPHECVACHTQRLDNAPAMPHAAFPSCGFCHRQGPPPPIK
jgi:hypothetical protein